MEEHGIPDVLIGGFPCVTYSNAANIHNKKHCDKKPKQNYQKYVKEGGELFLHMRRMIGDMQPKAFVIEKCNRCSRCKNRYGDLEEHPLFYYW